MKKVLKGLAAGVLALLIVFCAHCVAAIPLLTTSSVAGNRLEHQKVLTAALLADGHYRSNAEWPDEDVLAERAGMHNVHLTPGAWLSFEDACPSFAGAKGDRFILSTWRGEYFDCLAYPSGRHTFGLSVWDYVFGSVGVLSAILLSTILICGLAIRKLLRS